MNKNKFKTLREQRAWTQADLAAQTNLSIRTIQRVESGRTIPKGHTLKVLAEAFEVDKEELLPRPNTKESISEEEAYHIKLINLSALGMIGIPFGNLIFPFFIWRKHKDQKQVNSIGRRVLNFQIIWSITTYLLMIISPSFYHFFPVDFSVVLFVFLIALLVNLFFIIKTAIALSNQNFDILHLKVQLI